MDTNVQEEVTDARKLGHLRFTVLGVQHLFAMFGATILVPALTGLPVSTTLLFAGLGTLLFHLISQKIVPVFLGSSFAFIGGYLSVKELGMDMGMDESLALAYACNGVCLAGLCYFIMAAFVNAFGLHRVLRLFPPVVTGPMVISIGLTLSGSAIKNCTDDWPVAIVAILTVIICTTWGKGIVKITPILIGVCVSYLFAVVEGNVDFTPLADAAWIGFPISRDQTVFAIFDDLDTTFLMSSALAIIPITFATIVEHIGDMCAVSSTVGKNFLNKPGLHLTLIGDGLATCVASFFGAPANTTYGENTGVLNMTRVYDPAVIRLAACFCVLLSFCPKFVCLIGLMPTATIGGVSLILYGMIASVGVRNLVESRVDFMSHRNVFVVSLILVIAIGVKYGADDDVMLGGIHLSGLAIAAIVGIVANAFLPGNIDMSILSSGGSTKSKGEA